MSRNPLHFLSYDVIQKDKLTEFDVRSSIKFFTYFRDTVSVFYIPFGVNRFL